MLAVICVSWLMPWYVLWALPFAALSRSRLLRGTVVVVTAWLVMFNAGLAPVIAPQLSRALTHTSVARANTRFEKSLLTNPVPVHPHRRVP